MWTMSNNITAYSTNFSCFINVSDDSISEGVWIVGVSYPEEPNFDTAGNGYAISAIVSLLLLLGLPWNLFVICAIAKKRPKIYTQPIIMLMLNLAITNLLVCILVMPFHIVSGIAGEYVFGESDLVRCQVCQTGVVIIILPWVSIHTLCLMSIDRLIYLKRPLMYAQIMTPRRMLAAIIASWVLCVVISIPPLVGFGEIRFAPTVASCAVFLVGRTHIAPNYIYTLLLLAEIIVPVITLFIAYVWILCITRSALLKKWKRRSLIKEELGTERRDKHSKEQLCLVRFFSIIFTVNLVTWLPMIALVLCGAILGPGRIPTVVYSIAYLSYLSETVLHPVFEALHIREVKSTICKMPTCFRRKCDLSKLERKQTQISVI